MFAEYNNSGPGALTSGRVSLTVRLSEKEAAGYSKEHIFAPFGWEADKGRKWYDNDFQ